MTAIHSSKEELYYTDTDVARLLDISVGRLRNKLTVGTPYPRAYNRRGVAAVVPESCT